MTNSDLRNTVNREEYYAHRDDMIRELEGLNDDNFRAVYRGNRVSKSVGTRKYQECYASPFHVRIDADGDVVPCCVFFGCSSNELWKYT